MTHFGFGGQTPGQPQQGAASAGVALMLICRFVDRDGDGLISTEDLFTTQALIAQRSHSFLRLAFRVYVESIWYPGQWEFIY